MASEKRLAVLITANAKQAQQEFGKLGSAAEKSGSRTTRALSGMQKGLVGLGVGAAALGSFKAFEESEKIARQTDAVIKSTGGSAQVTSKHISDLASEMSKLGGVDDELVQQGENMLLTFTKVRNEAGKGNDVFDQATRAANDYAAATGTDVVNANKMLGKALNDPIKGLTALTRAGVSFTQQQKDQIRALVDAGDTLGAQKIILAEFNKEFGGSLEANATASGKAQVAMENLGESVGSILAPGLTAGAGAVGGLAQAFGSLAPELQATTIALGAGAVVWVKYGDNLRSAVSAVTTGVPAAVSGAKALSESIGQIAATRGVSKTTATIEVLKSSLSGLSTTAVVGATAAAGVTAAFVKMQVDAERAKNNVKDLQRQIEAGTDPVDAVTVKLTNTLAGLDGGFEGLAGSSAQFRKNLKETGITASDVAEIVKMPADEWKRYSQELLNTEGMSKHQASQMVTNLALIRDASSGAVEAERIRKDLVKETGIETGELADKTGAVAAALESWAGAGGAVASVNDTVTQSIKDQFDAQKDLNDEMRTHIDLAYESVGAALSEREAHDRVQDATVALAEARRTNDPEQIQRAQDDLTRAILGEAAAADEAARKSAELQGKQYGAAESASVQQARLAQLQTQTGFTSNEIKWLSAQLDNAARQRQISIDTSQAISNVRSLIGALEDLSAVGRTVGAAGSIVGAGVTGAIAAAGQGRWGAVTAYAKGGITPAHITRDQLFKYGEPATGGEAFVPRNGDKKRSMSILGEAAGWYGMQVVPMRRGGVIYEDEAGWDWRTMGNRRRGPVSRPMQSASFGSASPKVNPGPRTSAVGGAGAIVVQLMLDGRQISQVVVNDVNRQARMGRSPLVKA